MQRNISRRLGGVLLLMGIGAIGYVLTDFDGDGFPQNAHIAKSEEDYMGLDGELSILPLWCSTCALIGTSGHLLNYTYGSEIDENHSCIFRLGFSPIRGVEQFVGARTTARIVDSFSFFPFLKRPWKLMNWSFKTEAWILFGRRPGDISWFHQPLLSRVVQKYDTKFLWMTKKSEGEVYSAFKNQVPHRDKNNKMSALWFALKIAKDAGCTSLKVYGIPDHQICKRQMDIALPSFYWDNRSHPVCQNGVDASFSDSNSLFSSKSASFEAKIPTIPERRAMLDWITYNIGDVNFQAPHWPI